MAIPVPMECGRVRDAVPLTLDVGTVITWRRQIREKLRARGARMCAGHGALVDEPGFAVAPKRGPPDIEQRPWNATMSTGLPDVPDAHGVLESYVYAERVRFRGAPDRQCE